ncbi:hypothetical protein HQ560_20860 [bacterium]|nr:hypothetical protein [bacterium]
MHNIDIANWLVGHPPVRVVGFGGRARRQTGDQFDFFSLDLEYSRDCHIHSMCRQVNGCWNRVAEYIVGTKGTSRTAVQIARKQGIKIPDFPEHGGAYTQEHVDLLKSITDGKPINEAENVANATMVAIMGRISAYTGQGVAWDDVMKPTSKPEIYNLTLKPTAEDFETGKVVAPKDDVIAIPGMA